MCQITGVRGVLTGEPQRRDGPRNIYLIYPLQHSKQSLIGVVVAAEIYHVTCARTGLRWWQSGAVVDMIGRHIFSFAWRFQRFNRAGIQGCFVKFFVTNCYCTHRVSKSQQE